MLCLRSLDYGFQSLLEFRISWTVFQIPDFTSKNLPVSHTWSENKEMWKRVQSVLALLTFLCICIILSIDLLFLIIVSVNLILVISSKNYPIWQKGFFYRYHYWNQMCNCYKRFTIMFNTFLNPLYTKMAPRMTCSFHCFPPSPSYVLLIPTS